MRLNMRPSGEIRAMLDQSDEYRKIFKELTDVYETWRDHFDAFESPGRVSGWGHDYVCPDCAGRLIADRRQPLLHICSQCSTVAPNRREVLEAWVYTMRSEISESLVNASLAYYIHGDAVAYDYVAHVIDWYAEHYAEFPEHGEHAGQGRVMGQSLDEAVWGIKLLRAIANIGIDTCSSRGQRWYRQLFLPAARLVMSQQSAIHNIPLWHASYAISAALLFGDERLYASSMNQEMGGLNQIIKGFTPDGIWYENSNLYHYYSLEAAANLCVFLDQAMRPNQQIYERVLQAALAPVNIAYRDGVISAMNDGWKGTDVRRSADLMRRLVHPLKNTPGAGRLSAYICEHDAGPSLNKLLFDVPHTGGTSQYDKSILLGSNRIAVLRSPQTEVYIKFGNLTRSHAHPDALSISFNGFSMDTGTPGYGSQLHREWFTKTLAHSTFMVDANSQNPLACGNAELSEDGRELTAVVAGAYPGVTARRALKLDGAILCDRMTVGSDEADTEHVIDWIFHSAGEMSLAGQFQPAKLIPAASGQGYEHLSDIRFFTGTLSPIWTLVNQTLSLEMDTGGAEVYVATSPDNPATESRTTIIVRKRAAFAEFSAMFKFGQSVVGVQS
ncbi:MAG: heparinase II/III-family protein [Oscillospiraceae bacterium]|nr:heparinase II/III-family protein [Oscillospiraceae bacterium]